MGLELDATRRAAVQASRPGTSPAVATSAPRKATQTDRLQVSAPGRGANNRMGSFPAPVPLDALRDIGERRFLREGNRPELVPLSPFNPSGKMIVFAHGILADPANQEQLIKEAQARGEQVWVLAYRTVGKKLHENGKDLADLLQTLSAERGVKDLTLVGHSLGGMTSKAALLNLTDEKGNLKAFDHIRFVGLAVPWGGAAVADAALLVPDSMPRLAFAKDLAPDGDYWPLVANAKLPPQVRFENVTAGTDMIEMAAKGSASVGVLSASVTRQAQVNLTVHANGHMSMLGTVEVRALVAGKPLPVQPERESTFMEHLKAMEVEGEWTLDLGKVLYKRGDVSAQAEDPEAPSFA